MRSKLRENGLSLVLLVMFLATWMLGQTIAGHNESNKERLWHGKPTESLGAYLTGSHFLEATFENWESEFLQMGVYVALTVFLVQKGSAESKSLSDEESDSASPGAEQLKNAPWPVRKGGWVLAIYENSLTLAFLLLFFMCFLLHGVTGCWNYNEDLQDHGQPQISVAAYMMSSRFWFESFQNWQSEFLAILSMVVLSIYLRQKGSPESKKVHAPHWQTGG